MPKSLLPIVATADNYPYIPHGSSWEKAGVPPTPEVYIPFHLTDEDQANGLPPVGLLRPIVLECLLPRAGQNSDPFKVLYDPHHVIIGLCFNNWVVEQGKIGQTMNDIAVQWRDEGKFPGPLGGQLFSFWN